MLPVIELVSLSGSESVGIVRLLMSLENPSPEVRRAIGSAVAWFDAVRLKGIRIDQVADKQAPKGNIRRGRSGSDQSRAGFFKIESGGASGQ